MQFKFQFEIDIKTERPHEKLQQELEEFEI